MLDFNSEFKKYQKELEYLTHTWERDTFIKAYDLHGRDDILQEIHTAFWNACETYEENMGCTFRSYWNICVKRHMINLKDTIRRKVSNPKTGGTVWQEGLDQVDDYEEAPDTLTPVDVRKDIKKALDNILTTEERNLYEMYFVQGLSQDEIAEVLGMSQKGISLRIEKLTQNPKLIEKLSAYRGEQ